MKSTLLGATKYNLNMVSWEILININHWFSTMGFVSRSSGELLQLIATKKSGLHP